MNPVFTIGHSTRSAERADRAAAGGRGRPPGRCALGAALADQPAIQRRRAAGAARGGGHRLRASEALGGLRHHPKGTPASANTLWQQRCVPQLRRLRDDRRRSAPGSTNCAASRASIARRSCAPRRCGGAATAASSPITCWRAASRFEHIMAPGKSDPATLTPGAQPQLDGTMVYRAPDPADYDLRS